MKIIFIPGCSELVPSLYFIVLFFILAVLDLKYIFWKLQLPKKLWDSRFEVCSLRSLRLGSLMSRLRQVMRQMVVYLGTLSRGKITFWKTWVEINSTFFIMVDHAAGWYKFLLFCNSFKGVSLPMVQVCSGSS